MSGNPEDANLSPIFNAQGEHLMPLNQAEVLLHAYPSYSIAGTIPPQNYQLPYMTQFNYGYLP